MMLRQRLVRQSALGSSGGDTTPPPQRRDQPPLFRQLSSDSLDRLLEGSNREGEHNRRHSVACGAVVIDIRKPSLKSAFSSALRRMSDACALTPRPPSPSAEESKFKEPQVVLPSVLSTFRRGLARDRNGNKAENINACYHGRRRFSTSDSPPPSYQEAISNSRQIFSWKTAAWTDFRRPKKKIDSSTNTSRIDQD